jgi:fatty acid desaturase
MDEMPAEALNRETVKAEYEIGRRHIPDFAWPTVWLALGLYAVFATSTYLALTDAIPLALAVALNAVFIYAIYTVVHEAVHANISARRKHLRWVDKVLGVAGCIPLWLFYHEHKRQHMFHHGKTNEDDDPDIYARGSFLGWCFLRLPLSLLSYFNPLQLYRACRTYGVNKTEIRITMASFAASVLVVVAIVAAGYGYELLMLWFLPWWIGQSVMLTFFTWTPHHDHRETGRYRNTRVSLWPGAEPLLLGQNLHLIHHMMPSIPYYRYRATFDELRPILEREGTRFEGFWPRPAAEAAQAT